ncbi:zinc-dependent alcohol dehydrogenase family protein [Erwiniaceae bacterium BAC15a-03b]|uniref:Zinc-dependent alcohol dehydrogenase family protein n=1 Tax=Winslowiella arboricola TaxID=2978220 RepID=A0A9J6PIS3_9GAMM|nr:zinc-dependent alcohol dehydrogenase family protein [Winslowiella arboricola]MCU5771772.1 zinc-dependent alcohol dehydrogenase family protein [Winslowiella arboricola]MCU5776622.1 zinc-dependent alcohol dehydrogenase family protein [Winslowiella arboricola]
MTPTPLLRAVVRQFGMAAQCVELERYDDTLPSTGSIAVNMLLAAINPSDLITISGAYPARTQLPFIPGFEGVGSVTSAAGNKRVLPLGTAGAWQKIKYSDPAWCFPVPDWLTDEQAATSYVNPMTAWLMLTEAVHLPAGAKLAINAANSAIGLMLLKMAKRLQLDVVAIVRSQQAAQSLDAASVMIMPSAEHRHTAQALKTTGGVDAVLDCIGGNSALTLATALKPGGKFISYGLLSGQAIPKAFWLERPDIEFSYFHLRQWIHHASQPQIAAKLAEVFALIRDGVAATHIAAIFPLTEIADALRFYQQQRPAGKILIRC